MISDSTKGLLACCGAHIFWGSGLLFWPRLAYLSEVTVLSQRMLWSCLFGLLLLLLTKRLRSCCTIFKKPRVFFSLALAAAVLAFNWGVYLWSLNNGKAIEASLGYYMTPIFNICMARVFFKEKMTNLQILAVCLAFSAVLYGVLSYGDIPYLGIFLGVSFAIYGALHKIIPVDAIQGLFVETLCVVPFALLWLGYSLPDTFGVIGYGFAHYVLLLGTIAFTGVPLMLFAFSAKKLPLTSLGFLQYLSPSLNFVLAVWVAGEMIKPEDYITFPLIWCALALYTWDLFHRYRKAPKLRIVSNDIIG